MALANNLRPDEQIIYQARMHWAIFLWPVLLLVAAVALLAADLAVTATFAFVMAALLGIYAGIIAAGPRLVVSDQRLFMRVGTVRKQLIDVPLSGIEDLRIDRSVIGRMLGYGTVRVVGGDTEMPPATLTSRPIELRDQVMALTRPAPKKAEAGADESREPSGIH